MVSIERLAQNWTRWNADLYKLRVHTCTEMRTHLLQAHCVSVFKCSANAQAICTLYLLQMHYFDDVKKNKRKSPLFISAIAAVHWSKHRACVEIKMPYGTWLTIYDVNILFYGCITMYFLIAWWFLSRKRGEEKNVRPSHVADKWVALGPVYLPCNMQIEHNFICILCKANGLAYRYIEIKDYLLTIAVQIEI